VRHSRERSENCVETRYESASTLMEDVCVFTNNNGQPIFRKNLSEEPRRVSLCDSIWKCVLGKGKGLGSRLNSVASTLTLKCECFYDRPREATVWCPIGLLSILSKSFRVLLDKVLVLAR